MIECCVGLDQVTSEVRALARFQGVDTDEVERALQALAPHLARYAELVLTERGFELIAGGSGERTARSLAGLSEEFGGIPEQSRVFLDCARRWDGRPLGLKLSFGPDAPPPTLYVRTLCPLDQGLDHLAGLKRVARGVPTLHERLAGNTVLYGLGFSCSDGRLTLKTYTLSESTEAQRPGFVSYRLTGGDLTRETKHYLPCVPWKDLPLPAGRWSRLSEFAGQVLGFREAGHYGVTHVDGVPAQLKLYVERIGAIPTDDTAT